MTRKRKTNLLCFCLEMLLCLSINSQIFKQCRLNQKVHFQSNFNFSDVYVFVFQALSDQSSTNGQFVSPGDIQLKCNYCKSSFCSKPEVLEWEVRFFSLLFLEW